MNAYQQVQAVLPRGPRPTCDAHEYVPTSEDDALRFMAPFAWSAVRKLGGACGGGSSAADMAQGFLLGVSKCWREKWDPTRGSFYSAAYLWGLNGARNERTRCFAESCLDSQRRTAKSGVHLDADPDTGDAFVTRSLSAVSADPVTKIEAQQIVEEMLGVARDDLDVEIVRAFVQDDFADYQRLGVSRETVRQARCRLLARYHAGQTAPVGPARPERASTVRRRQRAAGFSRWHKTRRQNMTAPEHAAAGASRDQIAAMFCLTSNAASDVLRGFREDVARLVPTMRKPPRGGVTPSTSKWYADALRALADHVADASPAS